MLFLASIFSPEKGNVVPVQLLDSDSSSSEDSNDEVGSITFEEEPVGVCVQ